MHISEGFLPPVHAIEWTVASAPFVVQGFRAVKKHLDERPEDKVIVASAGAFAFVLSAMKIPSVTGSSAHPTGVGLGTVLFKPKVMTALGSIVLLFQALLLAHGGLTTLGANIFSMAVVGPWASWFIFRTLSRTGLSLSIAGHSGSLFTGSDNRGTEAISKVDPGYKQWFSSIWTPSGSVESFLFAMQAALGAGLVGYVVGSRRQAKRDSVRT